MADPIERLKGGIAALREAIIVVVLLLLLVLPGTMKGVLKRAGFVKASIAGFEWELLQESAQKTQEATENVAKFEERLQGLNTRLDQIRRSENTPAVVRQQITDLSQAIEQTRTETRSVQGNLQNSLAVQRSMIQTFRRLEPELPDRTRPAPRQP